MKVGTRAINKKTTANSNKNNKDKIRIEVIQEIKYIIV